MMVQPTLMLFADVQLFFEKLPSSLFKRYLDGLYKRVPN